VKYALILIRFVGFAIVPLLAWGQKPVIFPGGVVNAASYATGRSEDQSNLNGTVTEGLASGSIASIFGTNLATSTKTATTVPLPRQLGGTSVSVYGIAAPLFYVSPTQINFQIPSPGDTTPGVSTSGMVVSTAAGDSDPYQLGAVSPAVGIFTLDGSGCGRGAVLNVSGNGSVSLNSPANAASPGDYISIYGTGNGVVYNWPQDGVPAPSKPLAIANIAGGPTFDFVQDNEARQYWVGRAPGLIGVDQFNFVVPAGTREGCAVPLQVVNSNISQPVTIAIHEGGGPCVDPPLAGYGQITWEKAITTTALHAVTETDTATVSLQASPGKQTPAAAPVFTEGGILPFGRTYFGASCPIPGYRSLDAGAITVQGSGFTPMHAPVVPLQSGQVSGLTVYKAALPSGTIQPGSFTVIASGGADVGAFQSTVQIGSPIQITVGLAGLVLQVNQPFTITWTGGDPNSWVTVKLVGHGGSFDYYPYAWVARASDGSLTIVGYLPVGFAIAGPVDIVVEVLPDPSRTPAFSAAGLSLKGQSLWKYTYRFEGASAQY
jgi:uncharacterized protein (TIGR03437 family)